MTDFSKMSEDELLRPDVASADPAPSADFGAMSEEELLAPDLPTSGGETPAQMPAPKPEGRALGFFERHGTEAEAATGVRPSDAYNDSTVGKVMDVAYSVAPFTGTAARAMAGKRQKSLDEAMKTGDASGMFGGMDDALKEWDETEGKKYDLYQRALKGEKADYSPIYARVFDGKTGRYKIETDGSGLLLLDDRYAIPKDEARRQFVKELATEQTAQTAEAKTNAAEDLANNTASAWMNLAHGATASLGFAGEFYLGGALAKGAMGTQALAATRLGKAFQAAEKGAKLGFKASAAKTVAEIAAPTMANAVARYEELTANNYGIDANGDLVLNAEGDGVIRGAAKAIGGAAFENATEVALGKGVNLLVKNGIGGAFKGIYHHCPKVAKLFDGTMKAVGDARIDGAKKLWTDAVKAYAKVQNAAHFEIMPVGEFAEEYVQGWGDKVVGFGNRATEKDASLGDFTKNFFDWDAGGKDLFFGIMGQSIALGGGAYATMRGKRVVDSINGRVIGTLKQQGYTASDIATMSAGTRLARASMEDPHIAQELGYDIIDLARMGGVREKDIEAFADNIKKMNADGFKSLPADEQQKVKDSVNQFAEVVYGASYAFCEGMENAEELLSHLGKSMQKAVRLTEERQGLGNYKDNRTSKVKDFTSRIDWTGTTDNAGNLNWQTDENGRTYLESQPIDEDGNGVRIYREGDHFRVVHPQSAVIQGHRVADLKEAHDWAATMDQFAQKKNRDREVMADYIMFNAQRLVPTKTDKKTGEQYGAPVMIANNAQDALGKFDWLSKNDVAKLQTAMANGNEGGGYKTADGTVIMFLDNLKDANDALLTLSHEIGGHLATKEGTKASGLSLVDTVAEVFKGSSRKDTNAYKSERRIGLAEGETKEDATNIAQEEALVYGNERRTPYVTPLQKAKTAVKLWLKERGMDTKLTDADFDAIAAAGLQRIRMTRTGDTGTQTVDGEGLTPTPTAQGTDLQNRYTYGKWVSDYRQQKDALDAARAATDAAEAAQRHADEAAKEQAKIDRMVADEDERQRILSEQEQLRKDTEHATKYGREMVADVLNGWYGKKGISAEQVNRIVEGATADEVREILDYIELEMDGKASDGTVLEVAKKVNAAIVKRTVSEKQAAQRKAFAERTAQEKAEREKAEKKLLTKFVNEVQENPNSLLAFWLKNGRRLFTHPQTKRVANKGKGAGFRYLFAGNNIDSDAFNQFFDGMHGDERAKWMRVVFGEDYKPAADGEAVGNDIANQKWIAFKRGIEQNNNEAQMADEDYNAFDAMLNRLREEYAAYEEWKAGDQLTAEERRIKDAIDAENAAIDAENAQIADTEEAWGDAVAMTADGKPVNSVADVRVGDGIEVGGEHLCVVAKDGDVVKLDADDGFGTIWTARFNKENGGWDVETQDAADEGGQNRDRTEDRGNAEQDGSEGREGRDAGEVGGKSGGNGAAAEAPSTVPARSLTLDGGTAKDIAAEEKRIADQKATAAAKADMAERLSAPLKGGMGDYNDNQQQFDLGNENAGSLFDFGKMQEQRAKKDEGTRFRRAKSNEWAKANGIGEAAHRSLGPDFDRLLAIAQSKDTPQGKWRRAKDEGFGTRTMDEYVVDLRADRFADGETRKAGAQSIVYRVGDKVVKFRDAEDFDGAEMDKVARHNELFPDTAYTVKDIVDADGKRRIVLEQPYIDIVPNSGTEARKQLVAALQERFGADNVKTHGDIGEKNLLAPKSWFRIDAGPWHIEDLKDLNLGIDRTDGKVKVWDAEIAYDADKNVKGDAQGRWRRSAVTPAEDAAYMDAVKRGDMETAQRMLREVSDKKRYSDDSKYQGTSAFNGAAPSRNGFYETKQERIDAWESGEFEDTATLGDYNDGIDINNIEFVVYDPRSEAHALPYTRESIYNIRNALDGKKKTITMYRSVPSDIKENYFRNGDWITPSRSYAAENARIHGWGKKYRIIKQEVSVEDIWWDGNDINEWGYDDGKGYVYKNTKNNRKLLDITYDDAGNVIPLSERFNADNADIRFRRRTYTPNLAAQLLAEKRILSTTDTLRELKAAKDGNAALVAAEKLARELAAQGSIDPVLRDLVKATKEGTPVQIAKGNLAALASSQAFSRWREILQDAQIALKEMETKYGVKTDASAYAQFDRNYGLVKDAMDKFYREIYEPLTKELKDNGVKADDFDEYLRAKHGPERNRMIAERSPYVLTALSDKRTQTIVKDILSGARDLDDAAILDISKKLGWIDKSGKRTQESKDFEDDLRGSGATTAHWKNVLAKFDADGLTPKMLGAEKLVRELTQRNRDLLVQTGRLSADQAALWEKLSPNYVPLKSDMEMDSNIWTKFLLGGGADKGGTGGRRYSDREYNHAYGRGTIADSPLSFAIQQYEESLNRAYDNVARQRLAALVRANPNMGKVFRYLSETERADLAKRIAILTNIAKTRALTAAEQDALTKMRDKLTEASNADKSIPTTKILGANGIMHEVPTLASIEGTKQSPTAVIAFKENGELKFIRLGGFAQDDVNNDPQKMDDVTARRIATAVKKQNMAELGEVVKWIRKATGLFSALRTAYSPTFLVSNLGADNTQAMRNIYATFGGKGAVQFEKYAFHAFKAAAATLSGNYGTTKIMRYAKEWAENGGKIGGLATDQIGDIQKKMARDIRRLYSQADQLANIHNVKGFVSWANDKRNGFADFVEKMNGIVEMSTRIAAYATARDMGQSINDAVAYSRDITVNFNRKGTATPWLNALYAFSNATIQDIHRSLVAFGEGRTGKGLGILAGRGTKMGFGLMVLGFLSSMLGFWQDDPEDEQEGKAQYKNAKEWQKQNVMGIRICGKTVGVPIRGLSRIPYYLGHQFYEAMSGRKGVGKLAADTALLAVENATDFLGQASTPLNVLTPSVLRPAVDIGVNKTFTGQQMYREPMSNTDVRSEMGRGTTSDAAKWIARALNKMTGGNEGKRGAIDVQPEKVAEIWNWLTGSAGKDIANIAGTAKDIATGDITDRPLKNIPYLSRFIRNLDENSARYYEARDAYDAAQKEYKTLIALDRTDDAQKVLDENPWLAERGSNKRWGTDLNEVKNFVSKLLELEKKAEGDDYDTIHAMRLKAQYQFMRRMEQPSGADREGMDSERELKRRAMPFLRASKKAKKDAERETTRTKRGLIPRSTR